MVLFFLKESKKRKDILPQFKLPIVDKVYSSSELWTFFESRIPSSAQLQTRENRSAKKLGFTIERS